MSIFIKAQMPAPSKINSGIPAPKWKPCKYPISNMKPGESFFVAETRSNRVSARLFPYRQLGWEFVTQRRNENGVEGIRVWRLREGDKYPYLN
jgi:hypothetical protein